MRRRHAVWEAQRFAVRSSAAAEDLPDASAGLYETYRTSLLKGWARRCGGVRRQHRRASLGVPQRHAGGAAGMAVLVQAMVDPTAAGVAFTAHPVTGDRDQVVVTAVPGLGDPLVSGEAVGEVDHHHGMPECRPCPSAARC